MTPHLLRYQGLAVDDYGFALDASNLGHPRLSFIQGIIRLVKIFLSDSNLLHSLQNDPLRQTPEDL